MKSDTLVEPHKQGGQVTPAPLNPFLGTMDAKTKKLAALTAIIFLSLTAYAQELDTYTGNDLGRSIIDLVTGWSMDLLENWFILLLAFLAVLVVIALLAIGIYMMRGGAL